MTTTNSPAAAAELPTTWNAAEVEARWYPQWVQAGVFAPSSRRDRKPYVIMMPPPNVTGSLHMGHAIFVTLQDILTRTHRMRGEPTLWLPGVDHAGIATQAVVERELKRHEGKTRHDLGRGPFLDRVWAWKHKNGDRIVEQLKAMGASADWTRERFTMDEGNNVAVNEAFVRLWNDGLVYRGERLINWDPALLTSVSDEEVEHEEKDGELWRFAYKVKGGADEEIVVATTRPETMLGDVAVAVHPDDERYTKFHGKELVHPFFPERKVTVIADGYVDKEFGTGAVKITPAHDPNDFEMGQRHKLPLINIFNFDATVNDAGGEFKGLERGFARTKVKARLEELGLTRGTTPIKHNVAVSQRSGVVIEPMLSRQFFVKTAGFAKDALRIVDGPNPETRILPEHWKKTWDHFHQNIRDWCVSRQLWWGHRIPVFYDLTKLDEVIETDANRKGNDTEATRAQADGVMGHALLQIALRSVDDDLIMKMAKASTKDLAKEEPAKWAQEEDVLDTWFSSGLWPFATLGWPEKTADVDAFYPGAVLETGSDILFFWVARMVWFGSYFMGKSPFKDVFLHTIVRDAYGRKMSKGEGNALDPLDVMNGTTLHDLLEKTKTYPVPPQKLDRVLKGIEKEYPEGIPAAGADGLRFTLAALSSHSRDVKLSIPRAAGYRNFMNKIWNAYRFGAGFDGKATLKPFDSVRSSMSLADKYIVSRLQRVVDEVSVAIDEYRFDAMANTLYSFFWDEFCGHYIELSKGALEGGAGDVARDTAFTVFFHVLDAGLRLLHPVAPFLTEDIWQRLPGKAQRNPGAAFCAVAAWPVADKSLIDVDTETQMGLVIGAATLIRNVRQEAGLSPRKPVVVDIVAADAKTRAILTGVHEVLARFAVLEKLTVVDRQGYAAPKLSGSNANGDVEVVVHLEGLIDPAKEKERLNREVQKAGKELIGLKKRFENADFVAKAPADVVAEGKANMAALDEKMLRLNAAIARLSS